MTALALVKSERHPELGEPLPLRWSQIVPDPEQPRQIYVLKETEELADNIQAEGQQTPVQVFRHPDPAVKGVFMLSAGERRWRAFEIIAKRTNTDPIVLGYVKIVTDRKKQFRVAFLENLHRKDYHPLDEAASYARLRRDGDSIEGICALVGRSRSHVDNYLRLNDLSPAVKDPNLQPEQQLIVTSAIDIAKSTKDPALQLEFAREVIDRQLNVNDTRLMLGVRASDPDYKTGGRIRVPAEDYRVFKAFLGRTQNAAKKHADANLGRLYTHRDDDLADIARDKAEIQQIRSALDRMTKQLTDVENELAGSKK
jgi:ParB/RepB/Spo0J family partition protein